MTRTQQEQLIRKCREDFVWAVNRLIIEPYNKATGSNYFITRQQKQGLEAVQELIAKKRRGEAQDILGVSIMSGKGTGKDAWTVWVILIFMFCFPYPKVPCISVSSDQLDKVLWSEISKWLTHSAIAEYFVLQNDKLFRKDVSEDVRGKQWFAFKKAANPKSTPNEQVETLQGLHADYMMQVVDEGSGVLNPVYEALENNQTGFCNFMILIFNPMHTKGYAVDTQYKNSKWWIALRWNAEDSEITNKDNHQRIKERYEEDSNAYRMNVLGLPPLFDEQTLINSDWIMTAIDKELEVLPTMPKIMAIDCGAGGDNSVIGIRRGNKVYPLKKKKTADSIELVNWAGADIDEEKPDCVKVDTIGIGWAVEGALREKKGAIVEAADTRRQADNPERFSNKRAEMWWRLREQFEKGIISIPSDEELKMQLESIKYETDGKGKIKIIEKKILKKEIGYSPDEGDTVAMLYFNDNDNLSERISGVIPMTKHKGTWMAAACLLGLL